MAFKVRDAVPEDQAAMCAIHRAAILAIPAGYYTDEEKRSWVFGLKPEGYNKGREAGERYRVAVAQGDHAGGFASTRDANILAIFVHPEFQGQGIGRLLLSDSEAVVRESGQTAAELNASLNAEIFYAMRGWRKTGTGEFTSRGGLVLKIVTMQKKLDSDVH